METKEHMITPRPYQTTARQWANQMLNQHRHPLVVMGGGTGKTKLSILVIQDRIKLREKILVIVPQIEILKQWVKDCSDNNINYGYINDEGIIGKNKDVYICMYQSLSNMLYYMPEKFCKQFKVIITDEAHRSSAPSYRAIYKHFHWCLRMGLTASPYRMDNQPLGEFYTDLKVPITNTEAKDQGFLCGPVMIVPEDYKNHVPDDPTKIDAKSQREIIKDKKIIGDAVKLYKDVFDGLPVIVPCAGFAHAQQVKKMYQAEGWKVEHLHSNLDDRERERIVLSVKQGKINILLSVGIGIEGMDIPGLWGVIWLRFTESLAIWIQFNARAARIMKGKKYYILADLVGNSVIHGRPDIDRQLSLENDYIPGQDVDRLDIENHICPICGVSNNAGNPVCWICGYSFLTGMIDGVEVEKRKRKLPKMIDGELVFIDEIEGMEGENEPDSNYNDPDNMRVSDNNISACNGTSSTNGNTEEREELSEPTQAQKVEILNRNLTGIGMKNKFKENLKWLD